MERSAGAGNDTAAFMLGITYLKGEAVRQDKTLGRQWIERAAENGNEYASDFLKKMNDGQNASFRLGHRKAMILSNATRALKKALKEECRNTRGTKLSPKFIRKT